MSASLMQEGLVVAAHGRHCVVEADDGSRTLCHPRSKKNTVVVGDRVRWQRSEDEGRIEGVLPRHNLLYRQDEVRTKSFAANLDQVVILLAAEPTFSDIQLGRALIAAADADIKALIVLNKQDLGQPFAQAWERLAVYRDIGATVLPLCLSGASNHASLDALSTHLQGHTTLVLGPSGVGKSTLVNRLLPEAKAQTASISHALNSGRHTTTTTTWYWLDRLGHSALIDSPGFQEFGLYHIEATRLAQLMPDLAFHLGTCRFHNCSHLHEPGCAVRGALEQGRVHPLRYRFYADLHAELSRPRAYG